MSTKVTIIGAKQNHVRLPTIFFKIQKQKSMVVPSSRNFQPQQLQTPSSVFLQSILKHKGPKYKINDRGSFTELKERTILGIRPQIFSVTVSFYVALCILPPLGCQPENNKGRTRILHFNRNRPACCRAEPTVSEAAVET